MHRLLFVLLSLLSVTVATGCRSGSAPAAQPTASADTWAVVDGREIKRADVDKAYQRSGNAAQTLSEEEILAAKLSLLDDLILQDILIAKAGPLKVEVADSELDKAFADAKKNIPDDAFQQELTKRGVTAADMREGLRRELLTQKVIEHEVGSKITVTAQEVSDFFLANRSQFNLAEESYHLAQIVVTPVREPQVANRTGDDAATPQAAAEKVKMLMERLKAGASFAELAMGYSEDPESAPRGGDLGLVPMSRLKQAPQQLRDAVLKKEPGHGERREHGRRPHARAGCRTRAGGSTRLVHARRERPHYRSAEGAQGTSAARGVSHRGTERRERRQLPRTPDRRGAGQIARRCNGRCARAGRAGEVVRPLTRARERTLRFRQLRQAGVSIGPQLQEPPVLDARAGCVVLSFASKARQLEDVARLEHRRRSAGRRPPRQTSVFFDGGRSIPRAISTRASPSRDGRLVANTVDASRPSVSHAFVCAALKLDTA